MKIIKQINYIFTVRERWKFFGLFLMQLVGTALEFLGISLIMPFVKLLIDTEALQEKWWYQLVQTVFHVESAESMLLFLTIAMMGIYVVKNLYLLLLVNLRTKFLYGNYVTLGTKMISCYMYKPYTFHLQRNSAEIVRTVRTDTTSVFSIVSGIFTLISDVLIILALVVYLFAVDFWLTLSIVAALVLCSGVYFLLVRKRIRTYGQENRKIHSSMIRSIQQAMGGIKEVKVMGREEFFADTYRADGEQYAQRSSRYAVLTSIPARLIETMCMCSIMGVLAGKLLMGQDLLGLIPTLSAFCIAALKLIPQANGINNCINSITYNLPALEAIYGDLKESEEQEAQRRRMIQEKKAAEAGIGRVRNGDVRLTDIEYSYPNTEQPVLSHVNLTIRHGSSVGIIGVTGAGKTTLVDIILGVLQPQKGTVTYGGLDIAANYEAWQQHIGYIPQNIYLIDDTIRNNVALGIPADQIDDETVWSVLESAQLADFVRTLKAGLDTVIGERGVRLSGGQRQRIGIARALYPDPDILFFDEATSALDNETEAAVMASINSLDVDKTKIIVAHRLTTLSNCDVIFKVENGRIVETKL